MGWSGALRRTATGHAALGVVGAITLTLVPPSAPAQSPLVRIAYTADDHVYTIAADGSDRRRVTDLDARAPAWSPDAGSIAFVRVVERADPDVDEILDRSEIWVAAADGGGARRLGDSTGDVEESSPTWSPDGQRIAFVRIRASGDRLVSTLMTVAASGGDERPIARISSRRSNAFLGAAWSPDGDRILVSRDSFFGPDKSRLYVVDVTTGTRRLLLRDAGAGGWSPVADRIVFIGTRRDCEINCFELDIANADGSGRRRLMTNRANEVSPSWSGDGERIVFASNRNYPSGESFELYSIRTDGSCLTWLTNGTARSVQPAVEPSAGASSDPGGCGPVPREPLIEPDVSRAVGFERVPTWWLGQRFGNLLLSGVRDFDSVAYAYEDCASYEPSACPAPFALSNLPVCTTSVLSHGSASNVSRYQGALVHTPPDDAEDGPQFFLGPTSATVVALSEGTPRVPVEALRRFPETVSPQGGLPRAELPLRFWRALERTQAAVRKYGLAGARRRLHVSRGQIERRLSLARKLRTIGPLGRLDCARR